MDFLQCSQRNIVARVTKSSLILTPSCSAWPSHSVLTFSLNTVKGLYSKDCIQLITRSFLITWLAETSAFPRTCTTVFRFSEGCISVGAINATNQPPLPLPNQYWDVSFSLCLSSPMPLSQFLKSNFHKISLCIGSSLPFHYAIYFASVFESTAVLCFFASAFVYGGFSQQKTAFSV